MKRRGNRKHKVTKQRRKLQWNRLISKRKMTRMGNKKCKKNLLENLKGRLKRLKLTWISRCLRCKREWYFKGCQGLYGQCSGDGRLTSIPGRKWIWGPPSLLSNGYQGLFPWRWSGRGLKLTAHLRLVPRHTSTPPVCVRGVVLSKEQEQLYLTLRGLL